MPAVISHEAIKQARKRAQLTQAQVAEKLDVTQALISQYERGTTAPPPHMLSKLADIYRTHPGQFFVDATADAAA